MARITTFIGLLVILGLNTAQAQVYDFDLNITVSDGTSSKVLTLGVDPLATDASGSEDVFAPPKPPGDAFDARLVNDTDSEDLFTDIRFGEHVQKTFVVEYQSTSPSTLTLSWDNTGLAALGTFYIVDDFDGNTFGPIDMTTQTSLNVSASAFIADKVRILVLPNFVPVAVDDAITIDEDDPATAVGIAANDSDADGDFLTISITSAPTNGTATFNDAGTPGVWTDDTIDYTPNPNFNGSDSFQYTVDDGNDRTDTGTVNVTVQPVNDAPAFTSTAVTNVDEDSPYSYSITTSDVDGDARTITAPVSPSWLTIVDNGDGTASLTGTPQNADVGNHSVTVRVNDGTTTTDQTFTVSVANTNDAPTFTSAAVTAATQDVAYSYSVTTNDVDVGDAHTITLAQGPTWLGLVDNGDGTATLSGTPANADVGDHPVTVRVNDGTVNVDQVFTVSVANVNDAPTFTSTAVTAATQDALYSYSVTTDDIDPSDALTVTAPVLPTWLTLQSVSGGSATLTGTPTNDDVGTHNVTLRVNDGTVDVDQSFTVTVANVNDPPVAGDDAAGTVEDLSVDILVLSNDTDVDSDALTITIVSGPTNGSVLVRTNGTADLTDDYITYTPTPGYVGSDSFTYQIDDGNGGTDTGTVTLSVNGADFSFTFTVENADTGSQDLVIGTAPTATSGFDNGYDRTLPPNPPSTAFDARFLNDYIYDFRETNSTTRSWTVDVQPGSGGDPITVSWIYSELPRKGTFTLNDGTSSVNMRLSNTHTLQSGDTSFDIVYDWSRTIDVDVTSGWDMVSVPAEVSDYHYLSVFPSVETNNFYEYTTGYSFVSTLQQGNGYWGRFPAATTEQITGTEVGDQVVSLQVGWNMIGGATCDVPLGNIDDPSGAVNTAEIYAYDPVGGYSNPASIVAGKGVWARSTLAADITLVCGPSGSGKSGTVARTIPESFDTFTFRDAAGARRAIHVGGKLAQDMDPLSYSLPPLAPAGFDVRFEDGVFLKDGLNADGASIQMRATEYPITVTLEANEDRRYVLEEMIGGRSMKRHVFERSATIEIANEVSSLRLFAEGAEELPTEFALDQNYPNPFNPVTTIRYALPEDGRVTLGVYDILGRQVETLLDREEMKAGHHDVSYDASGLSSGVYFYVIEAGSYRASRRMVVLK